MASHRFHGGAPERKNKRVYLYLSSLLVLLALAGGGWVWWLKQDFLFSERPEHSTEAGSLPSSPSSVQVSATITYAALSDALSQAVPSTFDTHGREEVCADLTEQVKKTVEREIGGDVGKMLGEVVETVIDVITVTQTRKVCQDVDYRVSVKRTGPVRVTPAGGKIRVELPVEIAGQAGFTGDLAKALALDKKNFRGELNAFADIMLDINERWCPSFFGSADFSWANKAELEIIHNVWLNVDGAVGPELKKALDNGIKEVSNSLTCDQIRTAVAPHWRVHVFPIEIPGDSAPSVSVVLTPHSVGFSGVQLEPASLRLAFAIEATTEVVTGLVTSGASAVLPILDRIPATSNRLSLIVPLRLAYSDLESGLNGLLVGKSFEGETSAGRVSITVNKMNVYPTDEKVALGVHFSLSAERRILDASGWVYVVARPVLHVTNQTLRVADVALTRQIDNDLWSILSVIFIEQIKDFLEDKAHVDLRPQIVTLRKGVDEQIKALAAKENIAISLNDAFVGLQAVYVADRAIEVAAAYEGTADVAVGAIKIPPKP